jgi:hypothetical protein
LVREFPIDYDFSESKNELVKRILVDELKLEAIKDISKEEDGIKEDKDYACLRGGKWIRVESKVRRKEWDDVLFEIWSDEDRRKPGWFLTSKAQLFFYAFRVGRGLKYFIWRFYELRDWWDKNFYRGWEPVRSVNKGYVTLSYAVPLKEVEQLAMAKGGTLKEGNGIWEALKE